RFTLGLVVACVLLLPPIAKSQGLTGTLIGKVKDEQGAAIPGGTVRVTSDALIGGPRTIPTNEAGQFRFPNLTRGSYTLDIEMPATTSPMRWDGCRTTAHTFSALWAKPTFHGRVCRFQPTSSTTAASRGRPARRSRWVHRATGAYSWSRAAHAG